jgi:hypothetical protein
LLKDQDCGLTGSIFGVGSADGGDLSIGAEQGYHARRTVIGIRYPHESTKILFSHCEHLLAVVVRKRRSGRSLLLFVIEEKTLL